jgi:hypothetical protein
MASIERTAYPRFRMETARELVGLSPTAAMTDIT